jgi:bilin biosynthesis protein
MRVAAHKMVGEAYYDEDSAQELAATRHALGEVAGAPNEAEELKDALDEVLRRRDKRDFAALCVRARTAADARVRIAALRALVAVSPWRSRAVLTEVAYDADETNKVRVQAARLIGRTGDYAYGRLDELIGSDLPERVRCGAVLGLGELGDCVATERLLAILKDPLSRLRIAALDGLESVSQCEAAELLAEQVQDPAAAANVRTAACRALARAGSDDSVAALMTILASPAAPVSARAAAVETLGRLGSPKALDQVKQACDDPAALVARRARIAHSRLRHVQAR